MNSFLSKMNGQFKLNYYHIFIFCIVSRLLTTIYYIEDPDSMRFALSVLDYDLVKLQPHFPAYPVFSFFAKVFYFFTGSFAISFSIIGAISTFLILRYTLLITGINLNSPQAYFIIILILFNPMIWLMANRYMPDLFGFALLTVSFYYLLKENHEFYGFFFAGMLLGSRLSFIPFLMIPLILSFYKARKKKFILSVSFISVFIWLIPLILDTGWTELILAAEKQASGHFNDFGGTVNTEQNMVLRLRGLFQGVFADAFGMYWPGRNLITVIITMGFVAFLVSAFQKLDKMVSEKYKLILLSSIIYFIWILLYQNVIFKSRHVLPLLLILIIIFSQSFSFSWLKKNLYMKFLISITLLTYIVVSIQIVQQHRSPTAIAQVKNELSKRSGKMTIYANPLINEYLSIQGIIADFVSVENFDEIKRVFKEEEHEVLVIGNFEKAIPVPYRLKKRFYHNPFVNRMWSEIDLYSYRKN